MTDWTEAACLTQDPELFFPVGASAWALRQIAQAKAICAGCDVRARCLDWAMEKRIDEGIWGGHTEGERLSMRRHRAVQGKPRFYVDAGPAWVKVTTALRDGWTLHAVRVATGVNSETLLNLARNSVGRITAESARRIAEADLSAAARHVKAKVDLDDESVSA